MGRAVGRGCRNIGPKRGQEVISPASVDQGNPPSVGWVKLQLASVYEGCQREEPRSKRRARAMAKMQALVSSPPLPSSPSRECTDKEVSATIQSAAKKFDRAKRE